MRIVAQATAVDIPDEVGEALLNESGTMNCHYNVSMNNWRYDVVIPLRFSRADDEQPIYRPVRIEAHGIGADTLNPSTWVTVLQQTSVGYELIHPLSTIYPRHSWLDSSHCTLSGVYIYDLATGVELTKMWFKRPVRLGPNDTTQVETLKLDMT